jgi:hypothetical protein
MKEIDLLPEFSTVRVIKLLEPHRSYDGSPAVMRPPRIGDTGAVVYITRTSGGGVVYTVENVASDGGTVWLADFLPAELELCEGPEALVNDREHR